MEGDLLRARSDCGGAPCHCIALSRRTLTLRGEGAVARVLRPGLPRTTTSVSGDLSRRRRSTPRRGGH
eukprot:12216943-Prorocentrum_lima.AAC.1